VDEPDELSAYRKHIAEAGQKAQEEFDKTLIALAGGGLGVSFSFLTTFIKDKPIHLVSILYYSWVAWSLSLIVVLGSYFCSIRALRRTLKQAYTGSVYKDRPGDTWAMATEVLNITGTVLFIIGLLLTVTFVRANLH
jgi:hypothetical protein